MSPVSTRRKIASAAAAALVWTSAAGCGAASVSYLQDGPFAGRGDREAMTVAIARIVMVRAEAPAAIPDPFVAQ